jgi:hypothetical protein
LVVKELATPALPGAVLLVCAASFASQQRNEIMKNNLRFVNRSAKFFRRGQRWKTPQPDHPSTPQPLSLLRLQRGLCCEGTNSRPVSKALQHACHATVRDKRALSRQTLDR